MVTKNNLYRKPILLQQLLLAAATAICGMISGIGAQGTTIDEAMPSVIPAEILADWKDQDGTYFAAAIDEIKAAYPAIADKITGSDEEGYKMACHLRRVARLSPYADIIEKVIFCEHHNFGGIVVGYHDNVQAGESDMEWKGSSKLCVMNFKTYYPEIQTLLSENKVIRDPCISFDATKVVFAMSGSDSKGSGYSIYEMNVDDPKSIRQLTTQMDGAVVADFEPCYLPNGDIMFTSTRNFQLSAHGFAPSTNMFIMNGEGNFMRRLGFDQAHTFYPVIKSDGTVLYTRWELNDRDLTNTMGLFIMYPDGCHQTEFFGNQTSWPFTMLHARPIPNSMKAVAVAGGHHGPYSGELMVIDNSKATNGPLNIQMIAPKRETKPTAAGKSKTDIAMGSVQFLFEYPYPLSENDFIVSWRSKESGAYRLYWMDQDGHRELLAWSSQSVCQAVPITTWKKIWGNDKPPMPTPQTDYTRTGGTFSMENVYGDPYCGSKKMEPIPQGTAKTLRVVELGYRAQGSGNFGSVMEMSAPSGLFAPAIFCPIAAWGASWLAKKVLGEAKIYDDGSARFNVPARTPVYFQVLNEKGYCIATMRSWSTLMPGEKFACMGCHENKSCSCPITENTMAMKSPPQELDTALGVEGKWFDFKKMVAPILDKNCAGCHNSSSHESGFDMRNTDASGPNRTWTTSYNSLMKGIGVKSSNNAINIGTIFQQSEPEPYGSFGSTKSGMIANIDTGHHDVALSDADKRIIACWIDLCAPHGGYYSDYLTKTGYDALEAKRTKWAEIEKENIKALLEEQTGVLPNDHGSVKSIGSITGQPGIGYLPARRALILKKVSPGNLLLTDLRGRVVFRMKLPDRSANGDVAVPLPAALVTGIYLASFEGVDGIERAKITVTQQLK